MESVAAQPVVRGARFARRLDPRALSVWALTGAIVLYLAFEGGGYDIIVRSQLGIVVWWIVLLGAAWGLVPARRLTVGAWAALSLCACFVVWTALASTWSQSSERSLDELSRVACYLGILLLGVAIHRDRERALGRTMGAVATAVVIVAALAVLSRLQPDVFPAARQTAAFLPGTERRLAWPLNYWNALAAFVALGLPLLLAVATSARTLLAQAAAAAGIPILVLCGYLTFSRGGAIAAAAALVAFILLAPERIPKLLTLLIGAVGSLALIAGAIHRTAVEHGFATAAARHQGFTLVVAVGLVCAGVALAQTGIGLAVRHGTPPRPLVVPIARARVLSGIAAVICVVLALLLGAPRTISHAWGDFKRLPTPGLLQDSLNRFGQTSGNGRYQYWRVAVNATSSSHVLEGFGPGTFQLVWLPRAPYQSYVENAHSLYVETLSDVGLVGLALLVGFFVVTLGAAIRLVVRSRHESRTAAAGIAAALIAFCVAAASDWIWQVPVLPAAFMLLAGAVFVSRAAADPSGRAGSRVIRGVIVVAALACLVAIALPLATTIAVRSSQAASARGDQSLALAEAQTATRLEPGAASAQVQSALVLELEGDRSAAVTAARHAVDDEPTNWSTWLVLSRLEAENGRPAAALAAFRRAEKLNPRSPVFRQ